MRESIVNLPIERVESLLLLIRGEKVIMDRELARFSVLSTSAQSYLRKSVDLLYRGRELRGVGPAGKSRAASGGTSIGTKNFAG